MERGSEAYEDDAVRSLYLAHRHSGARSPNTVMEEPAFRAAVGSVVGAHVVDLGCGDGSTAPVLIELGAASYLGIDGSAAMVELAEEQHAGPTVTFARQDLEDLSLPTRAFDLITSRMALHYVESLDAVFERINGALRPGGRLVFTVTHPVVTSHDTPGTGPRTSWVVDDYFVRGARQRRWFGSTVTWYHRTIGGYLELVRAHGFVLDLLDECEPDPTALRDDPDELERRRRVPLVLLVAASRADAGSD